MAKVRVSEAGKDAPVRATVPMHPDDPPFIIADQGGNFWSYHCGPLSAQSPNAGGEISGSILAEDREHAEERLSELFPGAKFAPALVG
jgi:hypothetical protein